MAKVKPEIDTTFNASGQNSSFKLDGLTGKDGEWHCCGVLYKLYMFTHNVL